MWIVDGYIYPKSPKNILGKTQNINSLLKTKIILNPKYVLSGNPLFTFRLPGWRFAPLCPGQSCCCQLQCNFCTRNRLLIVTLRLLSIMPLSSVFSPSKFLGLHYISTDKNNYCQKFHVKSYTCMKRRKCIWEIYLFHRKQNAQLCWQRKFKNPKFHLHLHEKNAKQKYIRCHW